MAAWGLKLVRVKTSQKEDLRLERLARFDFYLILIVFYASFHDLSVFPVSVCTFRWPSKETCVLRLGSLPGLILGRFPGLIFIDLGVGRVLTLRRVARLDCHSFRGLGAF